MYGLIGKMIAIEGKRDELMQILLAALENMPGCLSYIVTKDTQDENVFWVTEVWQDQESHQASLGLPTVQTALEKGRSMIAGFGDRFETTPIGGKGIEA